MVSPGTVVIPSDLPVGSELPITTQWNGRGQFTCDYPYPPTGLYTYGNSLTIPLTKAPGFSDVWATGYPGIGVRMYSYITGQPITANPTTTPTLGGPMGGGSPGLYFMYSIISAASNAVRLIKTGDIPSGTFPSTLFATDFAQSAQAPAFGYLWQNSNTRLSTWTLGSFTIASSTPTCSLSTASATFDMGTLPATSFTGGAGVAYPVWAQDQSLISGGCNASTVSMTFAGIAAAAPYSNAFANQGTAKGVALELWQKNGLQAIPNSSTPINFAPQGTGGKYTFSARYLQTAPTVTAGTVNATVTVTVNYK
ncbi:hypothetical protein GCM10007902_07310 [Dyella nitratireducens]|nr:hypothetical protein GCM10007902_07310 [Dyella nitratireducens]